MAVEQDHAGAALSEAATESGPHQAQVVAQHIEHGRVPAAGDLAVLPVDPEAEHRLGLGDGARPRPVGPGFLFVSVRHGSPADVAFRTAAKRHVCSVAGRRWVRWADGADPSAHRGRSYSGRPALS